MAEPRISFLYKAASTLPATSTKETLEKLKSYYRIRCKEVSKGYGLPQKYFSEQIMCSHCYLEWRKGTAIKVNSIKLSKRQKKRIKSQNKLGNTKKKQLLHSNEIEQICTFCKHSTKTVVLKPDKIVAVKSKKSDKEEKRPSEKIRKENISNNKSQACDVYSRSGQVFSLNNQKNTLKNTIKETKVIKNNKKKKDKFAGLCQKAVMMSAQLKEGKDKQNKLKLFLKPSS